MNVAPETCLIYPIAMKIVRSMSYLIMWDMKTSNQTLRRRVYRKLRRALEQLSDKGIEYEWPQMSIIHVKGLTAVRTICNAFPKRGVRLRVYRVSRRIR
jgi:hypothetical protein